MRLLAHQSSHHGRVLGGEAQGHEPAAVAAPGGRRPEVTPERRGHRDLLPTGAQEIVGERSHQGYPAVIPVQEGGSLAGNDSREACSTHPSDRGEGG